MNGNRNINRFPTDMPWRRRGNCAGLGDPTLMYPTSGLNADVDAAKAVCVGCPVKDQCLDHAITYGEYGVWGGCSERERKALRRDRARARREAQAVA